MKISKQVPVRATLSNHRNKWRIVISYYDEDHNRKQKTFSTGLDAPGNKRKAELIMREKVSEFEKKYQYLKKETDSLSVSDWVYQILEKKSKEVRDTSMSTYWANYNTYIKNYFEDIQLRDVTPKLIDEFYKELAERISNSTIATTTSILSRAFKEAAMLEYIPSNPINSIVKTKSTVKKEQTKYVYSVDEIRDVLHKIKDEVLFPIIYITVVYGLRREEVLGISWDDVDFENRILHIRKSVVNVNSEILVKEYCKTDSSVRMCTITDDVYNILTEHRKKQEMFKALYKDRYIHNKYDFVFCCQNGKIRSPRGLTSSYKYMLSKHDIHLSRLHDLRHTAATLMFEAGAEPVIVQHALGHSQLSTTMNIYIHNRNNTNSEAANIMTKLLG